MWAEPKAGCATISYLPILKFLRSTAGRAIESSGKWGEAKRSRAFYNLLKRKASPARTSGLFGRPEDVAEVDFFDLHRGLGSGLERRFRLGRLARGGLERVGEAKAQRRDHLGLGFLLVRARRPAVDLQRHADEELARELEVRIPEN